MQYFKFSVDFTQHSHMPLYCVFLYGSWREDISLQSMQSEEWLSFSGYK